MTVEQYIRDGIQNFNSGEHKANFGVGLRMAFFDAPSAVLQAIFTEPVEGKGALEKVGNIALRIFFFFILLSVYNVGLEHLQVKYDLHWTLLATIPVAVPWLTISGFVLLFMIAGYFNDEAVAGRRLKKKYRKAYPDGVHFTNEEYKKAEEVLRSLKPMTREKAIEKYSERIVDLLEISDSAMVMNGKYRRLGSIRAIEENREAGPEDDEE